MSIYATFFNYKMQKILGVHMTPELFTLFFFFSVYRLEEKEQEQKREYAKLHERYTELFKTHMDYMERTKILMGSADRLEGMARGRLPAVNLAQLNR